MSPITTPAPTRPAWMRDGACRSSDPNVFFPERGDADTLEVARSICRTCRVTDECLAYAITTLPPQDAGVYAGHSAKQLRPLRRQWRAAWRAGDAEEAR